VTVISVNMDQPGCQMIFVCELTIVIPWLQRLLRMVKAVSSTVELLNSVTSDSVNGLYFAMWAFGSKPFPIELVSCSDGWQRTWWHTIHMMPGLLVSSVAQCNWNHHEVASLELFLAIGRFKVTFIDAHHASKMIWKVMSLNLRIKTRSLLVEIMTSSNEVLKVFESDLAVKII
jgi:hypothetical protein